MTSVFETNPMLLSKFDLKVALQKYNVIRGAYLIV